MILATAAVVGVGCAGQSESAFRATLADHLEAIRSRDLARLMPTVDAGEQIMVILPNGAVIEGHDAFEELHREWFADPTWTITFRPVKEVITPDLAAALLVTTIQDETPRSGRKTFLMLVFRRTEAGWRLTLDQNTRIPAEHSTDTAPGNGQSSSGSRRASGIRDR